MMKHPNRTKWIIAAFLILATGIIQTARQPHTLAQVQATTLSPNIPTLNLTLVAQNGTQLILNDSDIADLAPYNGYGGIKKQTGNITNLGNYTGVPVVTLCNLVGGVSTGETLRITASDGYFQNFTYSQVNGDFVTYDNVTGQETQHNQSLTPILAYYLNGENITDGPLKLAIVGPEGLVTDSALWVKYIVKLEILSTSVPEFSPIIITAVFITATLAAVVTIRAASKRRKLA